MEREVIAAPSSLIGNSRDIDWEFPYRSQRAPVLAGNVVASSQPLATMAGVNAFSHGGNAIDAALAAAITLTVVEPCNNGLGSDLFAIVWDGKQLQGLNASGKSPAAWSQSYFSRYLQMPTEGWDSVTVPGAVSGWVELSREKGDLRFDQLFESAITYADRGFSVGHITADVWKASIDRLGGFPGFQKHFLPQHRAPFPGEVFRRQELAASLAMIRETNGKEMYEGDLARKIVQQSKLEGGLLTLEDLRNHKCEWVDLINQQYNDVLLHEIPPNGQGLAALICLGILNHLGTASMEVDSTDWVHYNVEAMKIAIRAAFDHISDPRHSAFSVEELLDPQSLARAADSISRRASELPPTALPTSEDTVYLSAADAEGRMVSLIQSNYMGFGSGIVIEGTGIAMQNRGAGFTLQPGHPNEVDGGKRPFHTIIPGFVTKNGFPSMAFGVMGGHMQHQGHVQMVTRIYDHKQNPQAASDAPRWHLTKDFDLILEEGFDLSVAAKLAARGHNVSISTATGLFGGAQLIYKLSDQNGHEYQYCAASDHRKEGLAVGL